MTKSISNKDVAKAKQILEDAKSDSESANSISDKDIAQAKKILSGEPIGGPVPSKKGTRTSMAGKKKKTTGEFRNGGVVDLGDFKGSF